jgi:hypothetical protein
MENYRLTWQESCATQSGSNSLMTLYGQESQAILAKLQAPFRLLVDQIDLTCGELRVQGPPQTRFGKIPFTFLAWAPCRTS